MSVISRIGFSTTIDPEMKKAERKVQVNNVLNAGCVAAGIGATTFAAAKVYQKATTPGKLNTMLTNVKSYFSKLMPESLAKKFASVKTSVAESGFTKQAAKAKTEVLELGKKAADGIASRLPKVPGKLRTAALLALAVAGAAFIFKSGELHQKAKEA